MGVHRIAQFLSGNGHAYADVVDSYEGFARIMEGRGPAKKYDIVGISTYSGQHFRDAANKIEFVRHYLGNVLLVTGGHGMKADHDLLFGCFKVDIAVTGPGELPMADICDNLSKPGSMLERFAGIRGISINTGGRAYKTPPRILTQEDYESFIDSFDFTKLPIRPKDKDRLIEFEMSFSTHCPNVCVFCSASSFNKGEHRRVIYYPEEKILEKLNSFIKHHIKANSTGRFRVMFNDDNLTVNRERFFRILEGVDEIRKRTGCEIEFECLSRFECLTDELLERAARLGVTSIAVGVESRVPEILQFLKPGADVRRSRGIEKKMLQYGIIPTEFFIVAPPVATVETILRTAEDMLEALKNGAIVRPFLLMETYAGSPAMSMGFKVKSLRLKPKTFPNMKAPYELPYVFRNTDKRVDRIVDEIERVFDAAFGAYQKMHPNKVGEEMFAVYSAMLVCSIFQVLGIKDKRMKAAKETLKILEKDFMHYGKKLWKKKLPGYGTV